MVIPMFINFPFSIFPINLKSLSVSDKGILILVKSISISLFNLLNLFSLLVLLKNFARFVASKISEIWEKRRFYINKSRKDYLSKINMESWSEQLKEIVKQFYIQFYYSTIISEINI